MSHDVIDQVRRYLDYAAQESLGEPVAPTLPVKPEEIRWYQRGPVVAGLAALLVLAMAIPALLNVAGTQSPSASELPATLAVGVDYVWPEGGFTGDPEEIAAAFARDGLGWTDFTTTNTDPEASADGPVWTRIDHAVLEGFEVLSIPIADGRRVLMQVGSGGIATGPVEGGDGQSIRFPVVMEAAGAYLHVRFVDPDSVAVFETTPSDLERGRVNVAEGAPIGGVIVVYVDDNGESLTAVGGHFGPIDDASIPEGQTRVEIAAFNIALTYPGDWYLAEDTLTPALSDPREVFSLGSFPLNPEGPNCAQVPSQALHDMESTDVFVTVQERRSDATPSGFDPRPDNFGPTPGSTDNVFYECLEADEHAEVGAIHWIWFSDQGRYFHVLVAIGEDASTEDTAAIWNVLDQMEIQPGN